MSRFRRKVIRRENGYALVAMMAVSLFASLMLFALAGLSVSLIRSHAATRERGLALQSAEVGLDYARRMLTNSLRSGTKSTLEPSAGESTKSSDLPSEFLIDTGVPTKVRIRVRNISPDELSNLKTIAPDVASSDFLPYTSEEAAKAPSPYTYGFDWTRDNVKLSESYFWIVEVTAYRGAFSTSLRSMLLPIHVIEDTPLTLDKMNSSFFPSTVVTNLGADIGIQPDGAMLVMPTGDISTFVDTGPDSAKFKANIQTNGKASIADGVTLIGDVTATNPTEGAVPGSVISGNPLQIFGRVSANSAVDGPTQLRATYGTDAPEDGDNVSAVADFLAGSSSRQGVNRFPITSSSGTQPFIPVQVPSIVDASTFPVPMAADGSGTDDVTLPSMNYRASSINTDQYSSKIIVNPSDLATSTPTRIFIDSAGDDNSNAVNIDSSRFENQGSPTSLQIFYGGNKPINIALTGTGIFKGVIYAPNSTVTTSGIGDFSGAIVSSVLKANHVGSLQLDPLARNIAPAGTSDSSSNGSNTGTNTSKARKPSGYKYATWQQIPGTLVSAE